MGDNANNESKTKVSFFKRLANFFKGLEMEFKKISWPDKHTLGKQTVAVTVVSIVLGCIIALIDMVVKYGVDFITM